MSSATDQLTIEYRPSQHLVAVRWVGTCTRQRLREVYEGVAALLTRTEASRVLFDTRERAVIDPEDARWVATEGYASLLADRATALSLAYAVPMQVLANFAANSSGPSLDFGSLLRVRVFAEPNGAIAWLLTQ